MIAIIKFFLKLILIICLAIGFDVNTFEIRYRKTVTAICDLTVGDYNRHIEALHKTGIDQESIQEKTEILLTRIREQCLKSKNG